MPRNHTVFVCRECGGEAIRWSGQCPHCRAWNTLEELHTRGPGPARRGASGSGPAAVRPLPLPISQVDLEGGERLPLQWDELNRVLGGGVVPGSLVLVAGEPGVGKSTLLMHLAAQAAAGGRSVLYSTGEESAQQVGMRARRLGAAVPGILLLAETDLDGILAAVERERPAIAIVDSIQTVQDPAVDTAAGSVSQVREATGRLLRLAKDTGVPMVLVGHVTKEGTIAGPRVLEHMVDTVLWLEGERGQEIRVLRCQKNRFGSTEEIGIFTMSEGGLREVADPSALLLAEHGPVAGTVVTATLEGSRPLLVELQALASPTHFAVPRRSANGLDLNRLHMIVAVLDRRAGVQLDRSDVLASAAGGIRVQEPAADLPLALAVWGSLRDRSLPAGTIAIGELGLAGEVRRVARLDRRLQEASRRGFTRAIVPPGSERASAGLRLVEVRSLAEALSVGFSESFPPGGGRPG